MIEIILDLFGAAAGGVGDAFGTFSDLFTNLSGSIFGDVTGD